MIPVLSAPAIREVDRRTIEEEPIGSLALMERAAAAFTRRFTERMAAHGEGRPTVLVIAGMGNNGGDGLAVARMLHQQGWPVRAVRVRHGAEPSDDHAANWAAAAEAGVPLRECADGAFQVDVGTEVLVDALFGTGLNAPLQGAAAHAVGIMNGSGLPIVAVDMPSGLFAEDNTDHEGRAIVRATLTLSFQVPKLAFFLAESAPYLGDWELLDIGLSPVALASQRTAFHLLQTADVRAFLRPRARFDHKGRYGHALLVAGSEGMMGAAVLASAAAVRSGCGLVTVHAPAAGGPILQSAVPEAMLSPDRAADHVTALPELVDYAAIGLGPGLRATDDTAAVLSDLLHRSTCPVVIDADGLNALALHHGLWSHLGARMVLTPHPGEFDRLAGQSHPSGFQRLQAARAFAQQHGCTVVLKGAFTAVCAPDGLVVFNGTGNPGMAKGGSGDALTGLLTGLLAQGLPVGQAAMVGVHLHGLAGDIAAARLSAQGMTAGDLVAALPEAWRQLVG